MPNQEQPAHVNFFVYKFANNDKFERNKLIKIHFSNFFYVVILLTLKAGRLKTWPEKNLYYLWYVFSKIILFAANATATVNLTAILYYCSYSYPFHGWHYLNIAQPTSRYELRFNNLFQKTFYGFFQKFINLTNVLSRTLTSEIFCLDFSSCE